MKRSRPSKGAAPALLLALAASGCLVTPRPLEADASDEGEASAPQRHDCRDVRPDGCPYYAPFDFSGCTREGQVCAWPELCANGRVVTATCLNGTYRLQIPSDCRDPRCFTAPFPYGYPCQYGDYADLCVYPSDGGRPRYYYCQRCGVGYREYLPSP